MSINRIAVDAGHGSNTAGKRTPDGYREHTANVKMAQYFTEAAERCGFEIVKTGWNDGNYSDDPDTALSARQKTIKAADCVLSVSFHCNAYGNGQTYNDANGIGIYIHPYQAYDSNRLATLVLNELVQGTAQKNRGISKQEFAMCNCKSLDTIASILIEAAFMTNEREASLLKDDSFLKETALETLKGVCNFLDRDFIEEQSCPFPVPTRLIKKTSPIMKGDDVRFVQWIIGVDTDGMFGPASDRALRAWQSANGLTADGIFGPACRAVACR